PPDFLFDTDPWKAVGWDNQHTNDRERYYSLARDAIGRGVLWALDFRDPAVPTADLPKPVNTGLSNVAMRTAGLDPSYAADTTHTDPQRDNGFWIDRARVFQTEVAKLAPDEYGMVDSSINDLPVGLQPRPPEPRPFDQPQQPPAPGAPLANYCQRQGRC